MLGVYTNGGRGSLMSTLGFTRRIGWRYGWRLLNSRIFCEVLRPRSQKYGGFRVSRMVRKAILSPGEECRSKWCKYRAKINGFCGHHVKQVDEESLVKVFIEELRELLACYPGVELGGGDDYAHDDYYPSLVVVVRARGGSWEEQFE